MYINQLFVPQQIATVFKSKRWKFRTCLVNKTNKINKINTIKILISLSSCFLFHHFPTFLTFWIVSRYDFFVSLLV